VSRTSRTVAVLVAICTLAASLLAVTATTASAGPGYHEPKVGTCYDLSVRELFAPAVTKRSVPCSGRHTSVVVHVQRVPKGIDWDGPMPKSFFRRCVAKVENLVGAGERALQSSAYDRFWFAPTKKERAHGARWLSCHLALWGGKRMMPLPTDGPPALDPLPLKDKVARCLKGANQRFAFTVCSKEHVFRVTGLFRIHATGALPTFERFQRAAIRSCPKRTSSRSWRWEAPDFGEWAAGYRTMLCYSKTRK
jgi:hypothetical protein